MKYKYKLKEQNPLSPKVTLLDTIRTKLDNLNVEYKMDLNNKVEPFKVIYKPVNKSDDWYDKFNDIIWRYNLEKVVKTQMKENIDSNDPIDILTMDIPLFIRLLEYSREDAQDDMDLHFVTENLLKLSKEKGILSMEDYQDIIGKKTDELKEENTGLWDNIRAKRERGEKPSPKGSKAYKKAVSAGKKINKEK